MRTNTLQARIVLLVLFAMLMPLLASAHDFEVNGIYYNVTSDVELTVEVTYRGDSHNSYSEEYSGDIVIPENVKCYSRTYNVTSIGEFAFSSCRNITSVTFGDNITSIGEYAFRYCTELTGITISSGVTNIGNNAFYGCSKLEELELNCATIGDWFKDNSTIKKIVIGNDATDIIDKAFYNCSALTNVAIGNSVKSIGADAFSCCGSLTAITIPESVTSIGSSAFYGCYSLASLSIGNSVKSIKRAAFSDCSSLKSVELPSSLTSIENLVFENCSSLTSITIPYGVTRIGDGAFFDCVSLTSIEFPASLETISVQAFYGCTALESITIPNSVTRVGPAAFYGTAWYNNQPNGVVYVGKVLYEYKEAWSYDKASINIEEGTLSIADQAFLNCSTIGDVTIPSSVTYIGESAFQNCTWLRSVTCKAVTPPAIVDSYTFRNIGSPFFVYVPKSSLETYKKTAYWSEFANISPIPATVVESGTCGDNLTWKLTDEGELIIEGTGDMYSYGSYDNRAPWRVYKDDITSVAISEGVTSIASYAFYYMNEALTSVAIPSSVISIGENAFYYCEKLTEITIPEGVESIGDLAFWGCDKITSVTVPASVGSIGERTFSRANLTSIVVAEENNTYDSRNTCNAIIETGSNTLIYGCGNTIIPEDVEVIGNYAFSFSESLASIVIPSSVSTIGGYAFESCRNLSSVTLSEGVLNINHNAFGYCTKLTSIAIPESVTSIGGYAFQGCVNLKSITIPESVMQIYPATFEGCITLSTIVLPKGLTNVGWNAFANIMALTDVYCEAENVPTTDLMAFDQTSLGKATLNVPANALENYKNTIPWSGFGSIKSFEKCATPKISYEEGEVVITCDTEGAEFKTNVTVDNAHEYEESRFDLTATYTITTYATKAMYDNSDIASLTLCWIPCTEEHEGETTGILNIPSNPVLIQSQGGTITLSGLTDDTEVAAYDLAGRELATGIASNGIAELATGLEVGNTAIVKIGDNNIKIVVK